MRVTDDRLDELTPIGVWHTVSVNGIEYWLGKRFGEWFAGDPPTTSDESICFLDARMLAESRED